VSGPSPFKLTRTHATRLRRMWGSAGWPAHDNVELDLLAAGYLERHVDSCGRDTLVVTPLGIEALQTGLTGNRRRRDPHEDLVERTAAWAASQGRLAFLRTQFRVKVEDAWRIAMPDVFTIRRTTSVEGLAPIAYEVKARRADLLGDIRNPAKRAGYRQVSAEFYYVIAAGIAEASDIPEDCGLIVADEQSLRVERPCPSCLDASRAEWGFAHWMSVLLADRHRDGNLEGQMPLGEA
jgi:hypothetical protein